MGKKAPFIFFNDRQNRRNNAVLQEFLTIQRPEGGQVFKKLPQHLS